MRRDPRTYVLVVARMPSLKAEFNIGGPDSSSNTCAANTTALARDAASTVADISEEDACYWAPLLYAQFK